MKSLTFIVLFVIVTASSLIAQTTDFYLRDLQSKEEVSFSSIGDRYNIDIKKPIILIAYKKTSPMDFQLSNTAITDLIGRYNLCDPELINVITVRYGDFDVNPGSWDNCLNFSVDVSSGKKSLSGLLGDNDLPAYLFINNGEIETVEKRKLIYPVHHAFNNYFGSYQFENLFFHSSAVDMMQYALAYYENLENEDDYRQLIPYFEHALSTDYDPIDYFDIIKYAGMLHTIGETEKAAETASKFYELKKAADTEHSNWRAYATFLMSINDTDTYKEVLSDINIALDKKSSPMLFIYLASSVNENTDKATSFIKRYCKATPMDELMEMSLGELTGFSRSNPDYHLLLSALYLDAGMPASAASYAKETLYLTDNFDALIYLGCVLLDANNLAEAKEVVLKASGLASDKSQKSLVKSLIKDMK